MTDKDHETILKQHAADIDTLKRVTGDHDVHINQLKTDQKNMKAMLDKMATKNDIDHLALKVDESVNGVLRDAINALPSRSLNWVGVAITLILGLLLLKVYGIL